MIDNDKVDAALAAISSAINESLNKLGGVERRTVLANVTISLFRACEEELDEESMDRLIDIIEDDEPDDLVVH